MGVKFGSVFSTAVLASPAAAAETVVCTCGPLNPYLDGALVLLQWLIQFTVGTNGVSANLKLRRGAAASSTLINVGQLTTVTAGDLKTFSGVYVDSPGVVAEQQYSLTLTIGSGSATSTVSDVCLAALVL